MARITILCPNTPGARCDLRCYVETHMPTGACWINFYGVLEEAGLSTRLRTTTFAGSEVPPTGAVFQELHSSPSLTSTQLRL